MSRSTIAMPFAVLLAFGPACSGTQRQAAAPEEVPPLTRRMLSRERYVALEQEWRDHAARHPRDGRAWAQRARAANYAGAPCDSSLALARRGYELTPNDATVLATYGGWRWYAWCPGQPEDPTEAIGLLERALALDPTIDNARVRLWVLLQAAGRHDEARAQLVRLIDGGRMPEPLVDFGHNLLAGLPPNAILLTNGDNDTAPAVALQAARGFRTDVSVVNVSLLNLGWYRMQLRGRPPVVPVLAPRSPTDVGGSRESVDHLIDAVVRSEGSRPLYVACTVDLAAHAISADLSLQGIVYRVTGRSGAAMDVDTSAIARNAREVYRLETATSIGLDWEAWSALGSLMTNYAAMHLKYAMVAAKAGRTVEAERAIESALTIAHFQRSPFVDEMIEQWAAWDASSPALARWRKVIGTASR